MEREREWRREEVKKRRGSRGEDSWKRKKKKGKKKKLSLLLLSLSSPQKSFFPFPLLQPLLPRFRSPPFRSGKAPTSSRSTLVGARRDTDSQTGGKRCVFSCSCLFCFLAFFRAEKARHGFASSRSLSSLCRLARPLKPPFLPAEALSVSKRSLERVLFPLQSAAKRRKRPPFFLLLRLFLLRRRSMMTGIDAEKSFFLAGAPPLSLSLLQPFPPLASPISLRNSPLSVLSFETYPPPRGSVASAEVF